MRIQWFDEWLRGSGVGDRGHVRGRLGEVTVPGSSPRLHSCSLPTFLRRRFPMHVTGDPGAGSRLGNTAARCGGRGWENLPPPPNSPHTALPSPRRAGGRPAQAPAPLPSPHSPFSVRPARWKPPGKGRRPHSSGGLGGARRAAAPPRRRRQAPPASTPPPGK